MSKISLFWRIHEKSVCTFERAEKAHSFKGCNMYLLEEIHEIVILGPEMRD